MGGPIWLGPLFQPSFVTELITSIEQAPSDRYSSIDDERELIEMHSSLFSYAYRDRMLSMLYVVKEELPDPLYFDHAKLARIMHTHVPQNKLLKYARSSPVNDAHSLGLT